RMLTASATASCMLPSARYTIPVAINSKNMGSRKTSAAIASVVFGFAVGSSFGPSERMRSEASASDSPDAVILEIFCKSDFIANGPRPRFNSSGNAKQLLALHNEMPGYQDEFGDGP